MRCRCRRDRLQVEGTMPSLSVFPLVRRAARVRRQQHDLRTRRVSGGYRRAAAPARPNRGRGLSISGAPPPDRHLVVS